MADLEAELALAAAASYPLWADLEATDEALEADEEAAALALAADFEMEDEDEEAALAAAPVRELALEEPRAEAELALEAARTEAELALDPAASVAEVTEAWARPICCLIKSV